MADSEFRWHYIIYKITNLDTGRYYVGQHRTTNPNDSYMGSGAELNHDYDVYIQSGKKIEDHFRKEILFDFRTFEEMNQKEEEIVNTEFISSPETYNVKIGGQPNGKYQKGCIIVEYDGRTGSLHDWSEWTGLGPELIRQRLKRGMQMKEILSIPPRQRDKIWFSNSGEGHTLGEWCKLFGLNYSLVFARLKTGMTIDKAVKDEAYHGRKYDYQGKKYSLSELETLSGISKRTLLTRILRYRWTVEKAVETPIETGNVWNRKYEWNGKIYTIEELAAASSGRLFKWTIYDMIKSGKSIDEIMTSTSKAVLNPDRQKKYLYHGEYLTMNEACIRFRKNKNSIAGRMSKGMTFEQAIDSKWTNRGKTFDVDGISKTIKEWSDETGIDQNLLLQRMKRQRKTMKQAIEMGKSKRKQ